MKYILWPSVVNCTRLATRLATSLRKIEAHSASRFPTIQLIISFVRASMAVNVRASPMPIAFFLGAGVFLLAAHEAPDFVNLNFLSGDIAERHVEVVRTDRAHVCQQSENCALGNASHPRSRADRIAFNERRDHRDFLVRAELSHTSSMPLQL